MAAPESTPADDPHAEFAALQKEQWKALDRAIYFGMTPEEARQYEQRALRIVELQRLLGITLSVPRS